MTGSRRAHLALVVPAVATAVLMAGCSGGDSTTHAEPQPSSHSSSGSGAASSPNAPDSAPSSAASNGVVPASGKLVETSYFTVRAPKHFSVDVMGEDFAISIQGAEAGLNIGIIDETGNAPTLAQLARNERKPSHALHGAPPPTRTKIAGKPAYLLVNKGPGSVTSEAGTIVGNHWIYLMAVSYRGKAENLRLLESVLATWQWK